MTLKIGINGFGRIGRIVTRLALEQGNDVEIVGINDLTSAEMLAHLFKYDSVHRQFDGDVQVSEGALTLNGKKIRITAEKDPSQLPWKELGAQIVLECTGKFTGKEGAMQHVKAGASKVIISAPSKDCDATFVVGVNHESFDPEKHTVISNASCTTNCLAPVAATLHQAFGIEQGFMTTIHSYTNDQHILDAPHKDLRRARAGAMSQIPTTTGAAKAVGLVLPELKGKLDGMAVRVPTPNVSCVDLVCTLSKSTTAEEVNKALKESANGPLSGILGVEDSLLVSSDFIGNRTSSIVDAASTKVIGNMVKVLSWYDNEVGFSARLLDLVQHVNKRMS